MSRAGRGSSCAPTAAPTAHATPPPTVSTAPTAAPTVIPEGSAQYIIPIVGVTLGCVDQNADGDGGSDGDGDGGGSSSGGVVEQSVVLHRFSFGGALTAVELSMAAYDAAGKETRGNDVWFLGVVITDPYGLVVQVGGDEWAEVSSHFYSRYWPDTWLGRTSGGRRWVASRDVHAAGLRNVTVLDYPADSFIYAYPGDDDDASARAGKPRAPPRAPWQVELVLAYQWGTKDPAEFNGQVTLHFREAAVHGVVTAGPSMVTAAAEAGAGAGAGAGVGTDEAPRRWKKGRPSGTQKTPSPAAGLGDASQRVTAPVAAADVAFLLLVGAAVAYVMHRDCRCMRGGCCPGAKDGAGAVAVEMPAAAARGAVAIGAYRVAVANRQSGPMAPSDKQPLLDGQLQCSPSYPQEEAAGKRTTYGSISV